MFKAVFTSEIEIRCTIEDAWQVLTDFDQYHIWNPFTPKVWITKNLGEPVKLTVVMEENKKPLIHKAKLSTFQPPNKIGWTMNWGPLLRAERVQVLEQMKGGRIRYSTADTNTGLLAPLVRLLYGKKITTGFDKVARSFRDVLEQ